MADVPGSIGGPPGKGKMKPGDGKESPFGQGEGEKQGNPVPGSLKGATDGESHETAGGKLVGLKDALDGCERILRDEFKDYPESALYMIGTIDEAKGEAKPGPPAAPAEPESKTEAMADPKPAADSKPKAKSEPQLKPGVKPGPEVEHATDTHES